MADVLDGTLCRLRPYAADDVDALERTARDPRVSRWMAAAFPSPYTRDDAVSFVALATTDAVPRHFVIEVDGTLAGGAGLLPMDGEHAGVAIFGYWLGVAFWGRGIATDAARVLARHGLWARSFRRLEARVFAPNVASARVLEKAGFTLEARLRACYVERDGNVCDGLLYARLASDPEP